MTRRSGLTGGRTGVVSAERPLDAAPRWKLEDAKARFSEVVRLARSEGPQRVSVRGQDAVVVISVEALDRLSPADPARPGLIAFMEDLGLEGLDIAREPDRGRDHDL